MNNAFYPEEPIEEIQPDTSDEQAQLTRLIETLSVLLETKEWKTLLELHFNKEEERIKRLLLTEAKKSPIALEKIYQLQGEFIWAQRYADPRKWVLSLTNKLSQLKKRE